jgi:predicted RNA-binding Zn-ribbon protein involved in translation (DUF1610 family)
MPEIQPIPRIPDRLVQLACSNCATTMVLTQINPDKPGYETRTFHCPRCGYAETKVFEIL